MHVADPGQLEQLGLTLYERRALMTLMLCGGADAATLCREGRVPSSKIYLAMEKLGGSSTTSPSAGPASTLGTRASEEGFRGL